MKKGIIFSLITAILFVTLEPVSKLIAGEVTPYAITFWRFLIGSAILLPAAIVKIKKNSISISGKDLGILAILGVLIVCASMLTLQMAVGIADNPSLIAIIFSSNSIFTIILAIFINKEKMTSNKAIALVLGVIGVVVCADFSSGTNLSSVALALFAAFTFSLYTVLGQKYTKRLGGIVQTGIAFPIGTLALLAVLLILRVDLSPSFAAADLSILIYLGIFITGIGYLAYFKAIEMGGAIMASLAFFFKPILTPFVTWIVNGIVPDAKVFIAVAFIVAASYFAAYRGKTPAKK